MVREAGARLWPSMIRWGWVLVAIALIWPSVRLETIPRIEGRIWPVTSVMRDIVLLDAEPGFVVVSGTIDKWRDCPLDRVEWRFGRIDGRSIRITPISRGRARDLPEGTADVGPWVLPMTRDEFLTGAFAFVWHDCHRVLPWLTQSVLYRPSDAFDTRGD